MWVCSTKLKKFGRETVFYDESKNEWDMQSIDYLVMCLCHFNGHVVGHTDGFDGVHGGYGVGQKIVRNGQCY